MILDKIYIPKDLKALNFAELAQLCEELKVFVKKNTATKEGHINSSLGVTELTVALHYVFDTPHDILIWDVGHQAYVHKVLTARKNVFNTNRQKGGLSGFTRSYESSYDPFGAGHSSTSISAATGFAIGNKLEKGERKHVAVIGDGALTGGMSFEALNHLGELQADVLIILNDNNQSIDANVGALSKFHHYEEYCASLGIKYLGEVDGHNVDNLITTIQQARQLKVPRMLRVRTRKPQTGESSGNNSSKSTFQQVFTDTMITMAEENPRLLAITPAMLSGSGLDKFAAKFPDRTFDVGIAEQHAVTMAAGLAADGYLPVVHLYSTFSQRAFDQIIHDVALQNLHVIFCLDRAGLVGQDGATHHGNFDPGFLNTIPGLTIVSPMDGDSLEQALIHAGEGTGPWIIRYPKGNCLLSGANRNLKPFEAFQCKPGRGKAVLSFGAIGIEVGEAIKSTAFAHFDFSYLKPLDQESLLAIAYEFSEVVTVEENSARGGLGDSVRAFFSERQIEIPVRSLALPDIFIEHGTRNELLELSGLDVASIRKFIGPN